MSLVVPGAIQPAVRPNQRVIAIRIHGPDAAPVVSAVAAGFGADIAAREWISQAIADETNAETVWRPTEKGLIAGVISGRHVAASDEERGTPRRKAGTVRSACAVRLAKAFVRNLDTVEVDSVGDVLVEI